MDQLIDLLVEFCQLANLKLTVNLNNQIDIYTLFLEAKRQGVITSSDLEQLKSIYNN